MATTQLINPLGKLSSCPIKSLLIFSNWLHGEKCNFLRLLRKRLIYILNHFKTEKMRKFSCNLAICYIAPSLWEIGTLSIKRGENICPVFPITLSGAKHPLKVKLSPSMNKCIHALGIQRENRSFLLRSPQSRQRPGAFVNNIIIRMVGTKDLTQSRGYICCNYHSRFQCYIQSGLSKAPKGSRGEMIFGADSKCKGIEREDKPLYV